MKQPLIVVAEDDRDIRDLLTYTCGQAGYRTISASDGRTAARLLVEEHPAALITDIQMPDMNGLELCRMARRVPEILNLGIMVFSANIQQGDVEAGLAAGADRYLPKPMSPRRIAAELNQLLATNRSPQPALAPHGNEISRAFTLTS